MVFSQKTQSNFYSNQWKIRILKDTINRISVSFSVTVSISIPSLLSRFECYDSRRCFTLLLVTWQHLHTAGSSTSSLWGFYAKLTMATTAVLHELSGKIKRNVSSPWSCHVFLNGRQPEFLFKKRSVVMTLQLLLILKSSKCCWRVKYWLNNGWKLCGKWLENTVYDTKR